MQKLARVTAQAANVSLNVAPDGLPIRTAHVLKVKPCSILRCMAMFLTLKCRHCECRRTTRKHACTHTHSSACVLNTHRLRTM